MKYDKIKIVIKNLIIIFCVFMTGFLGSMILIMKRTSDMTTTIIAAQKEAVEFVSIFGVRVMKFQSVYKDGGYVIDVVKNSLYDIFPIIIGFAALFIVLILTFIIKKMTRRTC